MLHTKFPGRWLESWLFFFFSQLSTLPIPSAWGLQDGYSDYGHYVFTQQCPKVPGEEEGMFFSLDSLLRISKLLSCIPLLTYPYVLLTRFTTFAKPQTNHWQGEQNYFDWIHGNLRPWGGGGPQAPLKHVAAWYAIKIERECLLGRQPTQGKSFNFCHTRKKL